MDDPGLRVAVRRRILRDLEDVAQKRVRNWIGAVCPGRMARLDEGFEVGGGGQIGHVAVIAAQFIRHKVSPRQRLVPIRQSERQRALSHDQHKGAAAHDARTQQPIVERERRCLESGDHVSHGLCPAPEPVAKALMRFPARPTARDAGGHNKRPGGLGNATGSRCLQGQAIGNVD